MTRRLAGNLSMIASKTFSGLNQNALRYLLPTWFSAYTGVFLRTAFPAIIFWVTSLIRISNRRVATVKATRRQCVLLFVTGAILIFGYMFCLLEGLTYTTPVASAICISTQPIWVFVMTVILYHNHVTLTKIAGILLGLGGALLIITTGTASNIATDPVRGDLICLCSALLYAVYLVVSAQFLKTLDKITVTKWTFLGAATMSAVFVAIEGWDAPVLNQPLLSTPFLVMVFVLVFSSTLSYFLLQIGLATLTPTVVALYGYLILIVSAIASYILGQDSFDWWQMLSMVRSS